MRAPVNADRVRELMRRLGQRVRGPGRVYFTGGATAVLHGWRESTIDIDLKADPEPQGLFEALAALKEELAINIEICAPDDFIPPLPGWRERSAYIETCGPVNFFHYDFYAQALAKIERGHAQDWIDVRAMLDGKMVDPAELRRLFETISTAFLRYPAIDPRSFRARLEDALRETERR